MDVKTVVPTLAPVKHGEIFRDVTEEGKPGLLMFRTILPDGTASVRRATTQERTDYLLREKEVKEAKIPQMIVQATVDENTGEYVVRLPPSISPKFISPSSTDRCLVGKIAVAFPRETMFQVDWEDGPKYHIMAGFRNGVPVTNLNIILGLEDQFAPAKA